MSHTHPIAVSIFDHMDTVIFESSNYTGYIPRQNENIIINGRNYRVSNTEYIYNDSQLTEVHILTIPF